MVVEGHIDVGTTSVQLDTTIVIQSTEGLSRQVHREAVVITDPSINAARAAVSTRPLVGDYGAVVGELRADDVVTALNAILEEQRKTNMHLNLLTEFEA